MRKDTKKIAELMDRAKELIDQGKLEDCQIIIAEVTLLLCEWVERNLSLQKTSRYYESRATAAAQRESVL